MDRDASDASSAGEAARTLLIPGWLVADTWSPSGGWRR